MKRFIPLFLALLVLPFIWSSCSSRKTTTRFQQAYGLLNSAPDSALSLLGEIDKFSLSEKDLAVYSLLYTIAQDKSGLDVDSDSLLGIAYCYFQGREQDSLYAKCQYYMGKYYLLNDSTRMAEECLTQAIRVSKEKGDYYTTYLALDRLSKSLRRHNPIVAIKYAKEAYQLYSEKLNDNPSNKVYLLMEIGNDYSLASKIDSARFYLKQALAYAEELGKTNLKSSVYQSLSLLEQKQENADSALIFSKKAWEYAPIHNYTQAFSLARSYLMADSVPQSMELLTQLCQAKSDITRRSAYQLLTECSFRTGDIKKAWEFTDSTLSIYRRTHESALKDNAAYYLSNSQKVQALRDAKMEKEKLRFISLGLIIGFLLLLLILLAFYRNKVLQYRNKTLLIKKEKEIEVLLYRSEKEKQELCLKQKEDQITLLKKYVSSIVDLQTIINESIKKEKRNFLLNDTLWEDIEEYLNALEEGFVAKLKNEHPLLSTDELRFCMLLRLGFTTKKLAPLYGIAENSFKQKQNKFKLKLGLTDSSISLRKYLQSY